MIFFKKFKKFLFLTLLFPGLLVKAQVAPAVRGGGWSLSAGAGFSDFQPDWGRAHHFGPEAFFDFDLKPKYGAEGEARWMHWNGNGGGKMQSSNYLLGPRYRVYKWNKFSFYGKFMMGAGLITYPDDIGSGSYFAYAPGGTVSYRINRRFSVRGDYEYEFWPSAPNIPGVPNHGLTPHGFSLGFAYKIF